MWVTTGMAKRVERMRLCLLAGVGAVAIAWGGAVSSASADEIKAGAPETAAETKLASIATPADASARPAARKPMASLAKGPYYVDFRARTAASWGHAFIWYGKSSERAVEVAGLTPKGDVAE